MNINAPQKEHLPALRNLWKDAFGDDDAFLDVFYRTAFSPDRCRVLTIDNEPVAALYWFYCSCRGRKMAYLYGIATSENHRGKGLCHTLMENTHAHLASQGCVGTVLVPRTPSLFAFYKTMGYTPCSSFREFSCSAEGSVTLRKLDEKEYAALRLQYLPEGGVVQMEENLTFLSTMASFYAGPDFLLAAEQEGRTLYGKELLGNASAAAAVVAALGCEKGMFRTPGSETPFAVYRPLDDSVPPPTYFGLAFD